MDFVNLGDLKSNLLKVLRDNCTSQHLYNDFYYLWITYHELYTSRKLQEELP